MAFFRAQEPVILKEGSDAKEQLATLESLRETVPRSQRRRLDSDIRALKAGIVGEDRILFELRNSHLPLVVIHDLHLEFEGLTAQIDFLVLTRRRNFVLECKNLYGDISVNARGDFVRSFGGRRREGIYSPITQNQRHLGLMKRINLSTKGAIMSALLSPRFDDLYRGLVVLANPKTILHDRNAKKEVKQQLVRGDQLVATIESINSMRGPADGKIPFKDVMERAERWLSMDTPVRTDYTARYFEGESSSAGRAGSLVGGIGVAAGGPDSPSQAQGDVGSMEARPAGASGTGQVSAFPDGDSSWDALVAKLTDAEDVGVDAVRFESAAGSMPVNVSAQAPAMPVNVSAQWPAATQGPAAPASAAAQWPKSSSVPGSAAAQAPVTPARAESQAPAVPTSAASQVSTAPARAESQAIGDGPDPDAPRCPVCGSTMVLRTAKRGARAGKKFWGCSEYPYCRGIINVGQ